MEPVVVGWEPKILVLVDGNADGAAAGAAAWPKMEDWVDCPNTEGWVAAEDEGACPNMEGVVAG